ncbi:MAG TPA: helix-hairpin-helix domain-containing protein, partial [Pyrinomonadaceae bacterium]
FEMEVPEIYDDTVVIKSAVREPGDRAKIAVASNEKDVDPVGACVGMKGSRVQAIIKELRGEKIDIIEWSDEPSVFAANALSPAKVSQVRITDINNRKMAVIVTEDQLSLAIGKKGQNVRLATRLVGWDIDIISEDVLKREITQQMGQMAAAGEIVPLTALQGVSASQADTLAEKGIETVDALAATTLDDLVDILDISFDQAEKILSSANSIVESRREQEEKANNENEDSSTEGNLETSETEESTSEDGAVNEGSDEDVNEEASKDSVAGAGETEKIGGENLIEEETKVETTEVETTEEDK